MLSICVETGTGLAIVCAAAFMASTPPAVHMTPVWPFAWRFSLNNVTENPDIRRKVIISAALIGGAAALLLGAVLRKRFRLPALLVLAIVVVVRSPSLGLLTVEAYPTSFQTSTTGFAAAAIVRGQALYGPHCASCHGPDGQGNGPAAAALRVKPTDLTLPHLWAHGDGEMFWWLSHGMDDPEGGLAMPSFAQTMSADDRWALIDYIRAHNAGLAMRRDPAFDHRVKAPGFAVACNGVNAANMADLLGHIVDVTADELPLPAPAGDTMINIALQEDSRPAAGGCAAAEPAALAAYAILADLPPERLAGTEFLVDSNGWLQAVLRPGSNGARRTRDDLVAAIRRLAKPSIRSANGGNHEYHH
jgi:mono/diheme cytochrome c family protein